MTCLSARIALVILFATPAFAQQDNPTEAVAKTFNDVVARNKGYGGSVYRIDSAHGVIWQGTAGLTAGPGSAPMTADTPFEVASITKAVTAATVLRLVEDGKLRLDSKLGDLLPADQVPRFNRNITIRQLLSHTSGLPDYWTDGPKDLRGTNAFVRAFDAQPGRSWHPDEVLDFSNDLPAKSPGSRFHYSDTNYVLLGRIIERITGQPLHSVFRETVFEPLGMRDTWLTYKEKPRNFKGIAPSHRYEDDEDLHNVARQSADWAGGGLMSTTRDLERFLRGIASGKLFKNRTTLEIMRESVPVGEEDISYGLGLYRVKLEDGSEIWGHDGHGNSFAYYWPQRDITFTGTLNQTENDWWPLVEAYIEGKEPDIELTESERNYEVIVSAGWDSLYMDRGINVIRPNGGYGNSLQWSDINITYGITDNDFLTLDLWQGTGLGKPAYIEFAPSFTYTHTFDALEVGFGYNYSFVYSEGNYTSHELVPYAAYEWTIGNVLIRPSLTYYFNLGPDAEDGSGIAKAASSFLLMRLDGSIPVYKKIVALEPWTAFGINFSYNTDENFEAFNGVNNLEFGLAMPIRVSRNFTISAYGAYSRALTGLTNTSTNTFWGGISAGFTY